MKPRLRYSISATSRAPRSGERDGEHYFFVTRDEFQRRLAADGLLEWREYNGNLYGTPRDFVEATLAEGDDIVMKPEVNGALAIKAAYPDAVLVFLVPDSFSNLRERILGRGTETTEEIAGRLAIAREEMQWIRRFDYLIINEQGHSENAVRDLLAIMQAERFRIHRYTDDSIRRLEDS
jgi:guanylate kinase